MFGQWGINQSTFADCRGFFIREKSPSIKVISASDLLCSVLFFLFPLCAAHSVEYEVKNLTVTVNNKTTVVAVNTVNGWIVFHQRTDNVAPSYNRSWAEYRDGFGSIDGNFWLGLDAVHQLACAGGYRLRIEMQVAYNLQWYSVEYDSFVLDNETMGYAIHLGACSGDACDPFESGATNTIQNHVSFTTWDRNNQPLATANNCALGSGAGFWFNACTYILLTSNSVHRCRSIPPVGSSNYTLYNLCQSRMMIKYDP